MAVALIVQLPRVQGQAAAGRAGAIQVHLVGLDVGVAREGGLEQRTELGDVPLAAAQLEHRPAGQARRIEPEGAGEGGAGGGDVQLGVEQQQGRVGRGDHRQGQAMGGVGMYERVGGQGRPPFSRRRLSRRKPWPG